MPRLLFKCCPRCEGDLYRRDIHDLKLTCVQCGAEVFTPRSHEAHAA
jgi:uncharacterized protein (DUF983 family)